MVVAAMDDLSHRGGRLQGERRASAKRGVRFGEPVGIGRGRKQRNVLLLTYDLLIAMASNLADS